MDALALCWRQRFGGARDIAVIGARQRTNDGILDDAGDGLDRFEITGRSRRKASLDHIDLEPLELPRDADLFILGHRRARRLLAVTQGGVKNNQFIGHGIPLTVLNF